MQMIEIMKYVKKDVMIFTNGGKIKAKIDKVDPIKDNVRVSLIENGLNSQIEAHKINSIEII